ncbi:MAG: SH3 domain-containing protein [Chloroflexi bacterium]|nr:SH3 domain-containing protein [Chloroflexota bacterium]
MPDDTTQQLPKTGMLRPPDPPPSSVRSARILAIVTAALGVIVALGAGYLFGTNLEQTSAEETLSAITQAVEDDQQTAAAVNITQTAIVNAFTDTPAPSSTPPPTATPDVPQARILPLAVQVRSAASEDAPVITRLNQDTPVEITEITEDGMWVHVVFLDGEGFVPATAIELMGGSLAEVSIAAYPTSTDEPEPTGTPDVPEARAVPAAVQVYTGPGENYEIQGRLLQDYAVQIVSVVEDGQWFEIMYYDDEDGANTGFVRADTVRITGGSLVGVPVASYPTLTPMPTPTPPLTATPVPSETPLPTMTATPDSPQASAAGFLLIVREGPSELFEVVGAVDPDEQLPVNAISTDGLWFQVDFPQSATGLGWVSAQAVQIAGLVDNLPIVRGPEPPVPTAVAVVVEGGQPPVVSTPEVAAPPTNVEPAQLPTGYRTDFTAVPGLNAYAYSILYSVDGQADGEPYLSAITIELAENPDSGDTRVFMDFDGELEGFDEDLAGVFPLTVGTIGGANYIYLEAEDFCLPADEVTEIQTILSDFNVLFDGTGDRVINLAEQLGAFGIVDEDGLLGLGGTHYQFLGLEDPAEASGFRPTEYIKADLWFSEDERILYAFALSFQLGPDSDVPVDVVNEIDPNVNTFESFEGRATIAVLPVAVNETAEAHIEPPAACDFLN